MCGSPSSFQQGNNNGYLIIWLLDPFVRDLGSYPLEEDSEGSIHKWAERCAQTIQLARTAIHPLPLKGLYERPFVLVTINSAKVPRVRKQLMERVGLTGSLDTLEMLLQALKSIPLSSEQGDELSSASLAGSIKKKLDLKS